MIPTKEQLVCSKEQSIELVRLGAPTKTLLEWFTHKDEFGILNTLEENVGLGTPAYTIGELAAIIGLHLGVYDVRLLADKVIAKLKERNVCLT